MKFRLPDEFEMPEIKLGFPFDDSPASILYRKAVRKTQDRKNLERFECQLTELEDLLARFGFIHREIRSLIRR